MAAVIPSHLPAKASAGERRLHRIFQALPEDCIVYYEPSMLGRHPDFVLILPTIGVLIIEVKGWYADEIGGGDHRFVRVAYRAREARVETHPAQQVRTYLHRFLDLATNHAMGRNLRHEGGDWEGRLKFPVNTLVTLPNLSRHQLDAHEGTLASLFPRETSVMRDELAHWETLALRDGESGGWELLDAIASRLSLRWDFPPLAPEQIKALRALVHPEISISLLLQEDDSLPTLREQNDVLQVLDLRQEDYALSIGSGHRILHGVAGSGKTLMLLARARYLRETRPDAQILLVCYNRTLAVWLDSRLTGLGIEVRTFHSWAWHQGVRWEPGDSNEWVGECLLNLMERGEVEIGTYDAILVDEAQDFGPDWFRCLLCALKDPSGGDLLIVSDGHQNLYPKRPFTWSDVGIQARGRTSCARWHLDQNYRNPREIIALSESFAVGSPDETGESGGSFPSVRIESHRCLRSLGAKPVLYLEGHREAESDRIIDLVKNLLVGRHDSQRGTPLAPNDIAILYPGCRRSENKLLPAMVKRFQDLNIPVQWLAPGNGANSRAREGVLSQGVKLQTIHSAKGLQYRAVIVIWLDLLPYWQNLRGSEGELADRRLIYVALTRTESFLALTTSQRSRFVREMEDSDLVSIRDRHRSHRLTESEELLALPS